MTVQVASRVHAVRGSETSASRRRAQELAARGERVINLAAGELSDAPPPVVRRALAHFAWEQTTNLYTETAGIRPLREALANRIDARLGSGYGADEVVVTCGAKQAAYLAALSLFGEGDDVLLIGSNVFNLAALIGD